ncbi:TolB family protein [Wukongibacter sp. M2B1]|uniref:TolB family protein n=1 Tax=Wukongibacter sp. M2B1 TaxID=3088895 RepID=UPI003D7B1DF5
MKKNKVFKIVFALMVLLAITACNAEKDRDRVIIKEPGKNITVIEDADKEVGEPNVSVEKIDQYKNLQISDWFNENLVIVSKENESLEKMKLEELSDSYPRSLYLYNLNTKEYKLLKEQENLFLGGATLSPDKKYLLYYGNSLGDPVYYVMNMDTLESFGIHGSNIGGAYSANWADNETVIGGAYSGGAYSGGAYSGGAYLASTTGAITPLDELKDKALFIVRKMRDKIYYNTNSDTSLMVLDLATKEKTSLNINYVYGVFPAPDGNQMLVLQDDGSKRTMILCDADGGSIETIAEGAEISGVSWSPDQRMIAYSLKTVINGTSTSGLYVYDRLTGEDTQIVVDVENPTTCWSPSGRELVYSEWNGIQYNSSIVYLKQQLQK